MITCYQLTTEKPLIMKVLLVVCFVLILFTKCVNRERAANKANLTQLESTSDTTEIERRVNSTDRRAIELDQKDSTVRISLVNYSKEGILLPIVYNIYNQDNELVDTLSNYTLKQVRILQKSQSKLPHSPSDKYCHFANYVKVKYERDTFILFGRNVLEITERYNNLNLGEDTVSILLTENFSMNAADDDGLTGCDDFSYVKYSTRFKYKFF